MHTVFFPLLHTSVRTWKTEWSLTLKEIVVSKFSGVPRDTNLYWHYKMMSTRQNTTRKHIIIFIFLDCMTNTCIYTQLCGITAVRQSLQVTHMMDDAESWLIVESTLHKWERTSEARRSILLKLNVSPRAEVWKKK